MDPGFEIAGVFYPFPQSFRIADPVLVREVTGLGWDDFTEVMQQESADPVATVGLVAVAVWQKHPTWRREKVVRYVESLNFEQLEFQAGGEGDDVVPPAQPPVSGGEPDPSTNGPSDTPG